MSLLQLSSKSQIDALLEELETSCHTKYISQQATKNFNDENWQPSEKDQIYFEKKSKRGTTASIPFIGFPYIYIGSKYLRCHLGKDEHRSDKAKSKKPGVKERPNMQGRTKKIDCPAVVSITRVASLTDQKFQIDKENTKWMRRKNSDNVKYALRHHESIPVKWVDYYYVFVSQLEDHNHECKSPIIEKAASTKEKAKQKVEGKMKDSQFLNSDGQFVRSDGQFLQPSSNDSHNHEQGDYQQYYQEGQSMKTSIEKEPNMNKLRMQCAKEHKSILDFIHLIEDESCLRNLRCSLADLKNSLVAHAPREEVVINVDSAYCFNVDTSLK